MNWLDYWFPKPPKGMTEERKRELARRVVARCMGLEYRTQEDMDSLREKVISYSFDPPRHNIITYFRNIIGL